MRICIHRGAHEIGGSCVELESQGQRLLLDLGLPLDAEENSSELLPAVSGLKEPDADLLGVLLSHPHMDHYGLLKHARTDLPVAMGAAARRILEAAAPWVPDSTVPAPGPILADRQHFTWGPFQITPYLVDHSAFDAYAFLIEADGQRVFYSGDFRAHGRKSKLYDRLVAHPPENIDVLLMEGSSLGRLELGTTFETESELEERFVTEFKATEGLALTYVSAQNIDRVVTIFRAAKRSGRRLVIDLYTAAILEATGTSTISSRFPMKTWSSSRASRNARRASRHARRKNATDCALSWMVSRRNWKKPRSDSRLPFMQRRSRARRCASKRRSASWPRIGWRRWKAKFETFDLDDQGTRAIDVKFRAQPRLSREGDLNHP